MDKKYEIRRYEYGYGDWRDEVVVLQGSVVIAFYLGNGTGVDTRTLFAGDCWPEGRDELIGVYDTEEEAQAAIDAIF